MGVKIYAKFIDLGVKHKDALEWTKEIAGVFGKLKSLSKQEKTALKKLDDDERLKKELVEVEIEQLVFFDREEEKDIFNLVDLIATRENGEGLTKEELDLLRQKVVSTDIALFGRMLASSPDKNVEAACQVAHAISVHPVVIEDDYFTAIDDLNNGQDDLGASHIGETRFAAGLFYSYICINRELLIENLGGNKDLAVKAIQALTEAAVKVAPTGKQNSFASRAYASYVLAEKGDQQPRSLSVAYLKPITRQENDDYVKDSIASLIKQKDSFDRAYGECADMRYELNVPAETGTLKELLDFIGDQ
jgi:CRISPR system Cascade subunit CasC